jgi:hypothetical protein
MSLDIPHSLDGMILCSLSAVRYFDLPVELALFSGWLSHVLFLEVFDFPGTAHLSPVGCALHHLKSSKHSSD